MTEALATETKSNEQYNWPHSIYYAFYVCSEVVGILTCSVIHVHTL